MTITRGLFDFLGELREHNNRTWFEANKDRYERDVRDSLVNFVADFSPRLREISESFVADPRPNGGSIFRIYRDTRFSKDKTPYKTNAGVHFRHDSAKDVHAPGFYLHLEPGSEAFMGAGIWHPDAPTQTKIRDGIVANPDEWRRVTSPETVGPQLSLGDGDKLSRPPRGYDPNHPLIEDLKRRDFALFAALTEDDIVADDFVDRYAALCNRAAPFMRFLTEATGLTW